jgi:hypothetical protein
MLIVDSLIISGVKFVLGKVAAAVESEMNDEETIKEELLAAQMQLELGEIDDEEFAAIERDVFDRLRVIKKDRIAPSPAEGYRVTGVTATFGGDEEDDQDEQE